jgi:DNA-binding NarL/FixJ family response regulator
MEPLRVLIADDHPMLRYGLCALLASIPEVELVGEAATGAEVIKAAAELQPDVVVMDLRMPGIDGIEATRRITTASPQIGVLVVTMLEDDDCVFAAIRAGARGYLLKDANQTEIIRSIQAVASGEVIFGPAISRRVIDYLALPQPAVPPQAFPQLSNREREILDLMAQGHSNTDIARQLGLRPKTVRNHISKIFFKLQVADRSEAMLQAKQAGLGRPTK